MKSYDWSIMIFLFGLVFFIKGYLWEVNNIWQLLVSLLFFFIGGILIATSFHIFKEEVLSEVGKE